MITYLLGLPGSGKTYQAVDRIFNNFSNDDEAKKDKKATFKSCYTNINEFNFDKIDNVYRLDFDVIYEHLKELHSMYKSKCSDEELVNHLDELGFKDTLFVIDEAHNHFDKKDIVLVWWLAYHRHLYHELILITQNLSLIESKYKSFSEFFYVAKPQSLILDKRFFKYNVFCSSRLTKASQSGSIKIKRNKKVFELYKSGDSINTSNIILKYVLISLIIFAFLFVFVYFFVLKHDFSMPISNDVTQEQAQEVKTPSQAPKPQKNIQQMQEKEEIDYKENKLVTLNCNTSICTSTDISVPPQLMATFIKDGSASILYEKKINNYLTVFYLSLKKDLYDFIKIKGEIEDEKDNKHIDLFGNDNPSK